MKLQEEYAFTVPYI
jgi:hypothetical protein